MSAESLQPTNPQAEELQKKFELYRRMIESTLGITLTLIEAVGLKKITEDVLSRKHIEGVAHKNTPIEKKSFFSIPIEKEIFEMFLLNFYSITPGDFWNLFTDEDGKLSSHTHEYFKRKQEELHQP